MKLPSLCGFTITDKIVQLLNTFPTYSCSLALMSNPPLSSLLASHELPLLLFFFCQIALHRLHEMMHLTQTKGKLGIRVIFVDSGTVWGLDPLLRIRDFDSAAELKELNSKRPRLLTEKYKEICAARFTPSNHFHLMWAFFISFSLILFQCLVLFFQVVKWPLTSCMVT